MLVLGNFIRSIKVGDLCVFVHLHWLRSHFEIGTWGTVNTLGKIAYSVCESVWKRKIAYSAVCESVWKSSVRMNTYSFNFLYNREERKLCWQKGVFAFAKTISASGNNCRLCEHLLIRICYAQTRSRLGILKLDGIIIACILDLPIFNLKIVYTWIFNFVYTDFQGNSVGKTLIISRNYSQHHKTFSGIINLTNCLNQFGSENMLQVVKMLV